MKKRGIIIAMLIVGCTSFFINSTIEAQANGKKEVKQEIKKTKEYKESNETIDTSIKSKKTKEKYDYLNKNNYPLVESNSNIGNIWTYDGELYGFTYKDTIEEASNTKQMLLTIKEVSASNYILNDETRIEFFRDINGKLEYFGASEFNLDWTIQGHITRMSKKDFANQEYIYMRIGKAHNKYDEYYTGEKLVKVRNEFYEWKNHWAKEYIAKAMDLGWIVKTNKFRPDDSITRAEFVKIINRSFGYTAKTTKNPFVDVKEKDWYYNEVKVAAKAGYISVETGKFRPNDKITREEVAAIITSIKKNKDKNLDKIKKFKDFNKISKWAQTSVEGAVEKGYMGKGGEMFNPKHNITRAEAIVTVGRIHNIM